MKVPTDKFKFFRYANPDSKLEAGVGELMKTEIMAYLPSLIVVDGVNAAMNLMGLDLEKNKDATFFSQTILKPLRIGGAGGRQNALRSVSLSFRHGTRPTRSRRSTTTLRVRHGVCSTATRTGATPTSSC